MFPMIILFFKNVNSFHKNSHFLQKIFRNMWGSRNQAMYHILIGLSLLLILKLMISCTVLPGLSLYGLSVTQSQTGVFGSKGRADSSNHIFIHNPFISGHSVIPMSVHYLSKGFVIPDHGSSPWFSNPTTGMDTRSLLRTILSIRRVSP